jgi:hypothetical protein
MNTKKAVVLLGLLGVMYGCSRDGGGMMGVRPHRLRRPFPGRLRPVRRWWGL